MEHKKVLEKALRIQSEIDKQKLKVKVGMENLKMWRRNNARNL